MPLYRHRCPECEAERDVFEHHPDDLGCRTILCERCPSTMGPILSVGRGLTYFEEGRGHWITNLGHEPVYITSHEQHKREMKKAGVTWATARGKTGTGGWM